MLGNPWKIWRKPSASAARSSDELGSVIATKRFAASASPTAFLATS